MDQKHLKDAHEVFTKSFGEHMTIEEFAHKHYDNPYALSEPVRIEYVDGVPAGMSCFMAAYLLENNNRHLISQQNDSCVVSDFRGQHIFTKVIKGQEAEDIESEFMIGLPNANSYPGLCKMGWQHICDFTHYIKIVRPCHLALGDNGLSKVLDVIASIFVKSFARTNANEQIIEKEYSEPMFSEDEITSINNATSIGFERDNAFFNWKLSAHKESPRFLILKREGQMVAYVLYHTRGRGKGVAATIDDFFSVGDSKEKAKNLSKLFRYLSKKVDMLDNPLVNENSDDSAWLKAAGLSDYSKLNFKYKKMPFILSPNADRKTVEYMKGVNMRNIDFDVYMD